MEAVQNWKLCHRCCRPLPETFFRFRSKDSEDRMHQCRECTTTAQRERRHARKTHATKRAMAKLTRHMAQTADVKRMSWLVSHAFAEFGGLNSFLAAWHGQLEGVRNDALAARESLNALTAVLSLSAATAVLEPPPRRADDMSNAELDEHMRSLLTEKLVENLEDVLLNLHDQGWRIEPPPKANAY